MAVEHDDDLFWPLWPIQRFGAAKLWVAAIGTFALIRTAGLDELLIVLLPIYLAWVAYTWIVPPIARRWLGRGA